MMRSMLGFLLLYVIGCWLLSWLRLVGSVGSVGYLLCTAVYDDPDSNCLRC